MASLARKSSGSMTSISDHNGRHHYAALALRPSTVRVAVAPVARLAGVPRNASKPYRSVVHQRSYSVTQKRNSVRSRSSAVTVQAFRDTHRAEVLTSVAQEFAQAWGRAMVSGPTSEVMGALEKVCDTRIEIRCSHPLGCISCKGIPQLADKLGREFKALHDYAAGNAMMIDTSAEPKAVLLAADDGSDTAFCLMQVPVKRAGKGGEAGVGMKQAEEQHYTYMVLKMDIMLDDTVRRVTSVVERGQLAEGFDPEVKVKMMEGAEKVQRMSGTVMTPFPHHLVQDWTKTRVEKGVRGPVVGPDLVESIEEAQEAWVAARKSGTNTGDMMARAHVTDDFQLFDAYGMLPMICDTAAAHQPEHTSRVCVLNKHQTLDMLYANKETYIIDCHVVDNAVSLKKAAGFVHWKSEQKNKATGVSWQVEGMEVHMYDPVSGGLRAVYLFGDAMDFEQLQLFNQGLATAEA